MAFNVKREKEGILIVLTPEGAISFDEIQPIVEGVVQDAVDAAREAHGELFDDKALRHVLVTAMQETSKKAFQGVAMDMKLTPTVKWRVMGKALINVKRGQQKCRGISCEVANRSSPRASATC